MKNGNLIQILLVLLLGILSGCGGSTQGTGGVAVEGKIFRTNGSALQNLTVTVLETGDSGITDQNGDFTISTSPVSQASLLIEGGAINTQVQVRDIPPTARSVRVAIAIEEDTNSSEIREVEIEEREESSSGGSGSSSSSGSNGSSGSSSSSGGNNSGSSSGSSSSSSSGGMSNSGSGTGDDSGDSHDDSGSSSSSSSSGESHGGDDRDDESSSCEEVDVEDSISALSSSTITVAGTTFVVTGDTRIRDEEGEDISLGDLAIGTTVRVQSDCEGDVLTAKDIRIED